MRFLSVECKQQCKQPAPLQNPAVFVAIPEQARRLWIWDAGSSPVSHPADGSKETPSFETSFFVEPEAADDWP